MPEVPEDLPLPVATAVRSYLGLVDRFLPGRVRGFYVVGSTALGAFRPGRSDIDFVAVISSRLSEVELRRLRLVHAVSSASGGARALARGRLSIPGVCNGVYVAADDMALPVSTIVPVASHTGHQFHVGQGFDVNPVIWKLLAERGIAIRGPVPNSLALRTEADQLTAWNLDNLHRYWAGWARDIQTGAARMMLLRPRWATAWGVLGAPRLLYTITTGEIIDKEGAGAYALEAFGEEWHGVINDALAYWRQEPHRGSLAATRASLRRAAQFVQEVVRRADEDTSIAGEPPPTPSGQH